MVRAGTPVQGRNHITPREEGNMNIQLKELIDKIKQEGVGEAEAKSRQIIADAEKQAADIVARARKESDEMVSRAKSQAVQLENDGKEALKQASRDLLLSVKAALTDLLDAIIKNKVSESLSGDVVKEIVPVIVREWVKKGTDDISVLISEKDGEKLAGGLMAALAAEMKKGVVIKPHAGIKAGFRIAEKDGSAYYDFTDEGIAENIIQHVNPVLADIIKKSVGGAK